MTGFTRIWEYDQCGASRKSGNWNGLCMSAELLSERPGGFFEARLEGRRPRSRLKCIYSEYIEKLGAARELTIPEMKRIADQGDQLARWTERQPHARHTRVRGRRRTELNSAVLVLLLSFVHFNTTLELRTSKASQTWRINSWMFYKYVLPTKLDIFPMRLCNNKVN